MADNASLLSFIARRHTVGREDVATDALSFILSRSNSAKRALSDFLSVDDEPLEIAKTDTRGADALGSIPDLTCLNAEGNLVALIESKFWAGLTHHQPVTYWEALPCDRPAVLLFLAPAWRINSGGLWGELVGHLCSAGHSLGNPDRRESLITASATSGERRLMLTSWDLLLDRLAQKAKDDCDNQASFEIAELQGLAADTTAAENPRHDENLKRFIAEAVKRVEQSGWANTDRLRVGQGSGYYGRYLRLAGALAWLGIDHEVLKQNPGRPLLLTFESYHDAPVSMDAVGSRLGGLAEPGSGWRSGQICVPITLPDGVDTEATVNAIVAKMERIAKLIDPDGPTYSEGR